MTDYNTVSLSESDALALTRAAANISRARHTGDKGQLAVALDENMQLWTAIQTLVAREDHPMNDSAKTNLKRLAGFVVGKTIKYGCDASDKTLDALENMNLQIAEGLLENKQG